MFALIKLGSAEAMRGALTALPTVPKNGSRGDAASDKVSNALFLSPALENHHRYFETEAAKMDGLTSAWADAALLQLAARRFGAPDEGWKQPARRAQIIRAAALGREASRAPAIVAAAADADPTVAAAAKAAIASLKLDVDAIRAEAGMKTPTIAGLKADDVLTQVVGQGGGRVRGEQLYAQAGCVACHTVRANEPMKGPFLGNITALYRRRELAEAIIEPNKPIRRAS